MKQGDRVYVTGLPGVYGVDPTTPGTIHSDLVNQRFRVQLDGSPHFIDCYPEWLTPLSPESKEPE